LSPIEKSTVLNDLRSRAKAPSANGMPGSTNAWVRAYGCPVDRNAHALEIAPFGGRVRVRVGEALVADTAHALLLEEGSLPPVFYIPRGDVHMDRLRPSATTSHCPFKGDASYFDAVGGQPDVAWSYESPLPAASDIAGRLAFYPDRAEIETVPFG
jgi:uncharacterized protein (DUF427 family)